MKVDSTKVSETWLSKKTAQRVTHNNLKLLLYKVEILQTQTDANKEEGSEIYHTISEKFEVNPGDLVLILLSGKIHLHLSEHVHKQNMKFWPSQ